MWDIDLRGPRPSLVLTCRRCHCEVNLTMALERNLHLNLLGLLERHCICRIKRIQSFATIADFLPGF